MPEDPTVLEIQEEWFQRPHGIHGVAHTRRVLHHAERIAEALGMQGWKHQALTYAALWHDIGRTHEGRDRNHGAKSAGKIDGLGLARDLDGPIAEIALFAVEYHCIGDQWAPKAAEWTCDKDAALEVWSVLKDADGLDRVRLGSDELEVEQLRHEWSKGQADYAMSLYLQDSVIA